MQSKNNLNGNKWRIIIQHKLLRRFVRETGAKRRARPLSRLEILTSGFEQEKAPLKNGTDLRADSETKTGRRDSSRSRVKVLQAHTLAQYVHFHM
jgi:hypothetical protein